MDFVNADRKRLEFLIRPRFHPIAVTPCVAVEIVNHRRRFLPMLAEEAERIGLQQERAALRPDLELVMRAFAHSRQKQFPDAATEETAHRIDAAIPAVEIADDADALCVRRPDGEIHAIGVADIAQMRDKLLVELKVISLGKKMQVHFAHDQAIAVGIADEGRGFVPAREMNVVINVAFHPRDRRLEKSFRPKTVRDEALFGFPMGNDAHFLRVRTKDADNEIVTHAMRPEDAERIGMRAGEEEIQLVDGHAGYFEGTHARFNLGSSAQNVARAFYGGCIGPRRSTDKSKAAIPAARFPRADRIVATSGRLLNRYAMMMPMIVVVIRPMAVASMK